MFIIANVHTGGIMYLGEVEITIIIKLSYRLHQKNESLWVTEAISKSFIWDGLFLLQETD